MASLPSNGSNGSSGLQDQLVDLSVATATTAVSSKLESLMTMVSSPLTGDPEVDAKLARIRSDLEGLTSTQSAEQEQIKRLLAEALNGEVLQHLTKEIENQINTCIDKTVAGLVEEELNKYIPKDLRDQVDGQIIGIQQLHIEIHNTEARRSNSHIRTPKHFGENLQPLINETKNKCALFPKTVNELLKLDEGKVTELVRFYGIKNPDKKAREEKLNWFLREIGVTYQYVYRRPFRPFPP